MLGRKFGSPMKLRLIEVQDYIQGVENVILTLSTVIEEEEFYN